MLTMKTIDSFNNVIIVDVKMPWLSTQSSLLPLRVTRARGFSIAVVLACSRRSDSRAREKNSGRKNEGRLEGESCSPPTPHPPVSRCTI